jgi:hypothetical protein
MEFSRKKLTKDAAAALHRVEIGQLEPFRLLPAPVYVFMRANEKFVSIKGPLDFFFPRELERIKPFASVYFPEFVKTIDPILQSARRVRMLLTGSESAVATTDEQEHKPGLRPLALALPPAPFEVSESILKEIGPVWWDHAGSGPGVEPFLITLFINELCEPLSPEMLHEARDKGVESFERALFRSAWAVFLALHLGYTDLGFIERLRIRVFEENALRMRSVVHQGEVDELIAVASVSLKSTRLRIIKGDFFDRRPERVSQKLASRLERVRDGLMSTGSGAPTIYGRKGFVDV